MIALAMVQAIASGVCVPPAAAQVDAARAFRKSRNMRSVKSGCRCTAIRPRAAGKPQKCFVPCDPEAMRATTEANLRALGLYPAGKRLRMDIYIMARNIGSEAGSRATGAEKLVMGEALVHRARASNKTFAQIAMFNGNRFGAQLGRNPAVATARDPFWEDIVAAELVITGHSGNLGRGATHYFAPAAMDAQKRKRGAGRNRFELYDQWTSGRDLLTWVGYIPGVDINRQFLLRKMPKTAAGRAAHARMRPIGRRALAATMPPEIFRAPTCDPTRDRGKKVLVAGVVMLAVAAPSFIFLRYGRR